MRPIILIAMVVSPLFGQEQSKPDPDLEKKIAEAIQGLGNDVVEKRERAMWTLEEIGKPALKAVERATASDDAEVSHRARKVLTNIRTDIIFVKHGKGIKDLKKRLQDTTSVPKAGGIRIGDDDNTPPPGGAYPKRAEAIREWIDAAPRAELFPALLELLEIQGTDVLAASAVDALNRLVAPREMARMDGTGSASAFVDPQPATEYLNDIVSSHFSLVSYSEQARRTLREAAIPPRTSSSSAPQSIWLADACEKLGITYAIQNKGKSIHFMLRDEALPHWKEWWTKHRPLMEEEDRLASYRTIDVSKLSQSDLKGHVVNLLGEQEVERKGAEIVLLQAGDRATELLKAALSTSSGAGRERVERLLKRIRLGEIGAIVWVWNGSIATMTTSGANKKRLGPAGFWPQPSPDGRWIAFYQGNNWHLHRIKTDGTCHQPMTTNDSRCAWSPDSKKLAYTITKGDGKGIYIANLETNDTVKLASEPVKRHLGYDEVPVWSPDSSKILYVSADGGHTDLYLYRPEDKKTIRVTRDSAKESLPFWFKDGKGFSFVSDRNQDRQQIFVVTKEGNEPEQKTDLEEAVVKSYQWSSDRRSLYLHTNHRDPNDDRQEGTYLFRMDNPRQSPVMLSSSPFTQGAWSPSGDRLIYFDGAMDIHLITTENKNICTPFRVETETSYVEFLWSPDGTSVVFTTYLYKGKEEWTIWRMDHDGKNSSAIFTYDQCGSITGFDPKGEWLFCETYDRDLWAISADGKSVVNLTDSPEEDRSEALIFMKSP